MSTRAFIFRYLLIINRLRSKPHTSYEELKSYFDYEYDIQDFKDEDIVLGFSKRTFQRDIKAIKNIYNIDIEYSRSGKGYYITDNELSNTISQRKMEYFDIYNYLQLSNNLTPYILLEKRRPQRTENIHGLIHAIKNRLQISFTYQKFEEFAKDVDIDIDADDDNSKMSYSSLLQQTLGYRTALDKDRSLSMMDILLRINAAKDPYCNNKAAAKKLDTLFQEERYKPYIEALKKEQISVKGNFSYLGYNAPWDLFGRRNEVAVEVE
jgi:hypothetical protein